MDILNRLKPNSTITARLKNEHMQLSTQLSELNREMLELKDVIRQKQKDIRRINIALIHKASHRSKLSLIHSQLPLQKNKLKTISGKPLLHCLQGGKI